MEFIYGSQDFKNLENAQQNCILLTNGLGGYSSVTAAFGVNRCDHGLLIAAESAPNKRNMIFHRLQEKITFADGRSVFTSTQEFETDTPAEEGFRHLTCFRVKDNLPCWTYLTSGVSMKRRMVMPHLRNQIVISWELENKNGSPIQFQAVPFFTFCAKGERPETEFPLEVCGVEPAGSAGGTGSGDLTGSAGGTGSGDLTGSVGRTGSGNSTGSAGRSEDAPNRLVISGNGLQASLLTNGRLTKIPQTTEKLYYAFDARDGRSAGGLAEAAASISLTLEEGEKKRLYLICGTDLENDADGKIDNLFSAEHQRQEALLDRAGLKDEMARQLVLAADAYLSEKESTGGKTLLAGYPFFGDWGRDTMISLRGCVLAAGRYEEAKDIMRTFLKYEQDGLVPNLFPDKNQEPMYNSVDAPLLLINSLYLYYEKTKDLDFVREAWPVMLRIMEAYYKGTRYGIHMDRDGLIMAGTGLYQLTWMDVCVNGFLPTPRHGKPVEINAYWYNCLKIMEIFVDLLGADLSFAPGALAEKVREAFREKFWMEEKGYLRDLVSGTRADEQIRCNQIWALSLPFTMLDPEQEKKVLACVKKHLYTPVGLRTLSPEDRDFHPLYGGSLWERDTAYHQGTVWPFPLGAYYLAYLKVYGSISGTGAEGEQALPEEKKAAAAVREALQPIRAALREGCIGQLPEIYDGLYPNESRGCFAQAWSVGELLAVFSRLEEME